MGSIFGITASPETDSSLTTEQHFVHANGETLKFIATHHKLDVVDLRAVNPDVVSYTDTDILPMRLKIYIPAVPRFLRVTPGQPKCYHVIGPLETLLSIALTYNLSLDQLEALNPQTYGNQYSAGDVILIANPPPEDF